MIKIIYLFIDTNIFYSKKFNIETGALNKIVDFSNDGEVTLLKNSILVNEYKSNLNKMFDHTIKSFKTTINDPNSAGSLYKINSETNNREIMETFSNYFTKNFKNKFWNYYDKLQSIDIGVSINSETIFNNYFFSNPPFEERTNKKNEFPDAFMADSIVTWKENYLERGSVIYVVSNDSGFRKALPESYLLKTFDKIDSCIDFINLKLSKQTIIVENIHKNTILDDKIIEKLKIDLDEIDVNSLTLDGINDYEIKGINDKVLFSFEKDVIDVDIIEDDDTARCEISVEASIGIEYVFSYIDYEESVLDPETGQWLYLHDALDRVSSDSTVNYKFYVTLSTGDLNVANKSENNLVSLDFFRTTDPITLYPEDNFYY